MDKFYQTLRKIQKKERTNATLAHVEDTFYQDIHKYLADLRNAVGNDFFAEEYNLIKDTQRVATEICERREHKITDAAVVNIHRSYYLFTGEPKFDLIDTTPLNLTPEEENFYFSLIESLKNHRNNISLADFAADEEIEKPIKETPLVKIEKSPAVEKPIKETPSVKIEKPTENKKNQLNNKEDEVLNHLDKISKAKVIKDEKVEPIEKQIRRQEDEEFKAIYGDENEFIDLDAIKIAKQSENVTLLVFEEVGSIVGVDEKVYGPFYPQDIVVMPKLNARIFVKNRKGRIVKI